MRGRNRLILVQVCIFVLLGAIVNVAVAWGCRRELGNYDAKWIKPTTNQLAGMVPKGWSDDVTEWGAFQSAAFGISITSAFHQPGSLPDGGITIVQTGWPLLGCEGATWWQGAPTGHEFPLPLRPICPGFAINTIFYGLILWLLCAVPRPLRRWLRIKRHRCAACGYQIAEGVGPVCSECGHPLARQAVDTPINRRQR